MAKDMSRLSARYLDDVILLSDTHAWTYVQIPLMPYEYKSAQAREEMAVRMSVALAQLVTNNQSAVDVHLLATHRPLDIDEWEDALQERVERWGPAPGWESYRERMSDRLEFIGFRTKDVYLGVCLGPRRGKGSVDTGKDTASNASFWADFFGPLAKIAGKTNTTLGLDDPSVSETEIRNWHARAEDVRRTLRNGALRGVPATAMQVASLIARPLWPEPLIQPPASASDRRTWGKGELVQLAEGIVTNHYRYLEVEQAGETAYSATLAVSRFPDVLHFPEQEPWMHFVESLLVPATADWSSRMSIVPPMKVQKDVGRKLADAKDQAQHIAESGTSVPLKIREQLEVATALEYQIDKERSPWAYARHRVTITGSTPEEVTSRAKTLIERYRELNIDLVWPSGDQLDLMLEQMPGDKGRTSSYYQRQDLNVVSGGMAVASSDVGDRIELGKSRQQGWRGPYIGATNSRVLQPVFFSPHVAMARNNPPGVAITGAPGGGKALALDTPIPTPTGWTTMGALRVGDQVLDENGKPCFVTHATDVMIDHECYEVEFDDGSVIVADADHRWVTATRQARIAKKRSGKAARRPWSDTRALAALEHALSDADPEALTTVKAAERMCAGSPSETAFRAAAVDLRKRGIRPVERVVGARRWQYWPTRDLLEATYARMSRPRNDQRHRASVPMVRTTREILDTLRCGSDQRANHSIPVAAAFNLPDADLPIDPYLLGIWLTDGTTVRAEVTSGDAEIIDAFVAAGYDVSVRKHQHGQATTFGVGNGFQAALRSLGVLGNKHIPAMYLRASTAQRLALLQGLMDGDGYIAEDGGCEFAVTCRTLADGVRELLHTLGVKTGWREERAVLVHSDGTRQDCGPNYAISFTTEDPVFCLPRKLARVRRQPRSTTQQRYITDVRPMPSVPVRCITVDSPNHLFLAGEACIPTHNSFLAFTLAYQMAVAGVWTIYIDPKADAKPMAMLPGLGRPRVFDLRDGNDGMLDPFSLGDKSEGLLLALETLRLLLGGQIDSDKEEAILNAVHVVAEQPQPSLNAVVEHLQSNATSSAARSTGTMLSTIRSLPFARLCFAPTGGQVLRPEDGLTVVTLLGLDLPSASTKPEDYSFPNRLAVSVMFLLTRYARQLMLSMDKDHPKAICIDEAWAITGTPQGAKLIPEIARMGRSHNTALVLVSQNAGDLMAESVTNSLSTKFAFRSAIPQEVDAVLQLMGLPDNQGFQSSIRNLGNGQCLMQDMDGRVAAIQIDNWDRSLMEAFDTNPETRGKKVSE